jgi:hypothetical protein
MKLVDSCKKQQHYINGRNDPQNNFRSFVNLGGAAGEF